MKGQKEAVVEEIMLQLPNFRKMHDNALLLLSADQLEAVKATIGNLIANGAIEYSKDKTNIAEVRSYARSMVMNHIKKAKELNGGYVITPPKENTISGYRTTRTKVMLAPKGVDPELLPDGLKEYVKTLA